MTESSTTVTSLVELTAAIGDRNLRRITVKGEIDSFHVGGGIRSAGMETSEH